MDTMQERCYLVVEFVKLPQSCVEKYVCVPNSWIRWREGDNKYAVSYPEEPASVTVIRVRAYGNYSENWKLYTVFVRYSAGSYDDAVQFIKLQNQKKNVDQIMSRLMTRGSDVDSSSSSERKRKTQQKPSTNPKNSVVPQIWKEKKQVSQKRPSPANNSNKACTKHQRVNEAAEFQPFQGSHLTLVGQRINSLSPHNANTEKIQSNSRNLQNSNQLDSKASLEPNISIDIYDQFIAMKQHLEENSHIINFLRLRHIQQSQTYNNLVETVSKHIHPKFNIPTMPTDVE